jgi:hypothetical protein
MPLVDTKPNTNKSNSVTFTFNNAETIQFNGVLIHGIATQVGDASVGTGLDAHQISLEDPSQQQFSLQYELDASQIKDTERILGWYRMLRNSHSLGLYQDKIQGSFYQMRAEAKVSLALGDGSLSYSLKGVFPVAWKVKSIAPGKNPRIGLEFSYETVGLA